MSSYSQSQCLCRTQCPWTTYSRAKYLYKKVKFAVTSVTIFWKTHKVKCKPYQKIVTPLIWRYSLITFPQTQTQTLPMSTFYTDRKDFCRHYFFIRVLTKGFEENWFRFDFTSCIWLVIFFSYLLNSFLIVFQ